MLNFFAKLINLQRLTKKVILLFIDATSIVLIILISFSLRLGYWYLPPFDLQWVVFGSPAIAIPIFYYYGIYNTVIRFIGFKAFWDIIKAVSIYSISWGLLCFMSSAEGIPRSVILINWLLAIITMVGLRALIRWLSIANNNSKDKKYNVLVYGCGSAGQQLSDALKSSTDYSHIAYIDDDIDIQGSKVNDVPVFSVKEVDNLINKYNISEILIALPSITRRERKKIIEQLSSLKIQIRSLPSLSQLAYGKIKINDLHEINIEDLLGRDSVLPNLNSLEINIKGKVVLVTGAGGSIGSELCRQVLKIGPSMLILFEVSEVALYQIDQELKDQNKSSILVVPILGSVKDKNRLKNILNVYSVQTIYHAAAYKHVPLVEFNQSEGVINNSIGTMHLAMIAMNSEVETFVLISTDKAVRPTNIMGATKRISEMILQALAQKSNKICFTMVRFGNVLDSSGSVIPLFKKQIREGGPVTVTDPNVIRYFMTISEAVELVIQAGSMSHGGDVFILDMGSPIRINDLAIKMIELSGLKVFDKVTNEGDIEIEYIGLRPGEKLFEELLVNENTVKTDHPLIMRAEETIIEWEELEPNILLLQEASKQADQEKIRETINKIVPEYKPKTPIVDNLYL